MTDNACAKVNIVKHNRRSCMGLDEDEFRTLYVLTYKALANMEAGD